MLKYFSTYLGVFALGAALGIWQHQNIAPFFEIHQVLILTVILTSFFVVFNLIDFYFIFHAVYTFLV